MTMVRGSNPIWYEVDLTAHAFDDTFYLFVLENTLPYIPATVWQDPFANVAWDNPIRFLANGTLPNNIYFDPTAVYRLEFRQGATQSDPLIYLVENYVPGSSGNNPIDETTFSTDNQISNPQFGLVEFASPYVLTSISSRVIDFAPGWSLHLTGTGNVTLTQVLLNSAVVDPTNASYGLQIQLSGTWTKAYISQRFAANGILWSNTFVSSSITALSGNAPQNISATIVDSQGNTLTSVLETTALTETFNEYQGIGEILASTNTDFPPDAYIEYQLLLPNNCNITLTSIQLISGDVNITYPYEQTTLERQLDHLFHYFQPAINFKPIPSLLTAWDFSLNPAQFGVIKNITTTPDYIWDQTICASAVNSMSVSAVSNVGDFLVIPTLGNDAFYMLQYLKDQEALKTTFSNLAVNISAYCINNPGTIARVYLFYSSTGGTIPTLPTTIGTIASTGIFTLTAANWAAVPQLNGEANSGELALSASGAQFDLQFNGWNGRFNFGGAVNNNFAIVVTFTIPSPVPQIVVSSISLVPGDIPTRPAPQTLDEVLRECQFYYEMSYQQGVALPGAITQLNAQFANLTALNQGSGSCITYAAPLTLNFLVPKRAIPNMTYYSPVTGTANRFNAKNYGITVGSAFSVNNADVIPASFWTSTVGTQDVNFTPNSFAALVSQTSMNTITLYAAGGVQYHYVADARLGKV